jgi:tRNA U34 5-methylaminomethyl-2-thiouridine-forming methyltransferase MnmC
MQRDIIFTGDGSHSIKIPELNVNYHSIHGAIQESKHVFIEAGFYGPGHLGRPDLIQIFEVGFGTGLNALLTLIEAEKIKKIIYYESIEPFPLDYEQIKSLNYCSQLKRSDLQKTFEQFHFCDWEKVIPITPNFTFRKSKTKLLAFETSVLSGAFELIYFDSFDPKAQPEVWSEEVFQKMFSILNAGGLLVTYSSKGSVRRALQAVGFKVEKIPGPPGKREITRAAKM